MTRWVVVTTASDNGEIQVYGPWRTFTTADRVYSQLQAHSEHYHGPKATEPAGDFTVQLTTLDRWPGIKAAMSGGES